MPEYINHNGYTVHLTGPDGQVIKMKSRQKMILSEYFDRYRARGFIKLSSDHQSPKVNTTVIKTQARLALNKPMQKPPIPPIADSTPKPLTQDNQHVIMEQRKKRRIDAFAIRQSLKQAKQAMEKVGNQSLFDKPQSADKRRLVGREVKCNPNEFLVNNLTQFNYPISNNIGIGILSFNRVDSLRRCVESIIRNTDLQSTTVFISDDGSDDPSVLAYLNELKTNGNLVVITNEKRIGIAGNSNRLLRCLNRFKYGILMNDDVEVLHKGWEDFYVRAFKLTGMHHFIFRQEGVYGAKAGERKSIHNVNLLGVTEKPQGAVLAFTNKMLSDCGYFDEDYGLYGMEHVDWSSKVYEFNLQFPGYYDVDGSHKYFKLHNDSSAVSDRTTLLKQARDKFENRKRSKCLPSDNSKVAAVSYIIPFRNVANRTDAIRTVVNNIRAQKFPVIDIHLIEQDDNSKISLYEYEPINYSMVRTGNPLFNKSRAFNVGVTAAEHEIIIMHDADILAPQFYTALINNILSEHEACHIGKTVVYANEQSSNMIAATARVDPDVVCNRVVGYYEGGSLACKKENYWRSGAFNEDFWGYGCEDCDFFARLKSTSNWYEERTIDFLHLHHGRVKDWSKHHDVNKTLETKLRLMTMGERINLQYDQMKSLGYAHLIEKYA